MHNECQDYLVVSFGFVECTAYVAVCNSLGKSFYFNFYRNKVSLISIIRDGNGTPLQYSCLENPMDGGAWWAAVHGVAKGRIRLSDFTFTFHFHFSFSLSLFTFMHWRRKWQPTPVFLPGESQGRGSLMGCRLWGRTESHTTEAT